VKPVGGAMGTWSQDGGYKGPKTTLDEDLASVEMMEDSFNEHLDGTQEVTSSSSGPMYSYFRALQRLLGRTDLEDGDRVKWDARRDVAMRLRFWPEVKVRFGAEYAPRLKKGYDALGRAVPEWKKLTRAGAFGEVAAFESAGKADAKDALYLLTGLRDLDAAIVLKEWL
jgi:hypothetical protein